MEKNADKNEHMKKVALEGISPAPAGANHSASFDRTKPREILCLPMKRVNPNIVLPNSLFSQYFEKKLHFLQKLVKISPVFIEFSMFCKPREIFRQRTTGYLPEPTSVFVLIT